MYPSVTSLRVQEISLETPFENLYIKKQNKKKQKIETDSGKD